MNPIRMFENLLTFSGTLTSDATNPDDGGTLTLGDIVYTFKTNLSTNPVVPNEIKIGASAAATLDNVKLAVNGGTNAGEYSTATQQNPLVDATTNTNTTQLFVKRAGSPKRDIRFEENATHLTINAVNGKLLGSYVQAPSTSNQDFELPQDAKGFIAILSITAETGTATLDVKFQYRDPFTGKCVDIPGASFAQKSATGDSQLSVYPGLTASANVAVTQAVPRYLRCVAVEAGGSSDFTYNLTILPVR